MPRAKINSIDKNPIELTVALIYIFTPIWTRNWTIINNFNFSSEITTSLQRLSYCSSFLLVMASVLMESRSLEKFYSRTNRSYYNIFISTIFTITKNNIKDSQRREQNFPPSVFYSPGVVFCNTDRKYSQKYFVNAGREGSSWIKLCNFFFIQSPAGGGPPGEQSL